MKVNIVEIQDKMPVDEESFVQYLTSKMEGVPLSINSCLNARSIVSQWCHMLYCMGIVDEAEKAKIERFYFKQIRDNFTWNGFDIRGMD
jgi:hypothetical protein